jgi:hypothetical protein
MAQSAEKSLEQIVALMGQLVAGSLTQAQVEMLLAANGGWRLLRGRKAFAATAGNGAQGTVALFDVTGDIQIQAPLLIKCSESLAGALATIEIGVTGGAIDEFVFGPLTATDIDSGMWWDYAASGFTAANGDDVTTVGAAGLSANIFATVATADISDGQLDFFIWWRPLSSNGNLALATGMAPL